jgi:hypothetical protein
MSLVITVVHRDPHHLIAPLVTCLMEGTISLEGIIQEVPMMLHTFAKSTTTIMIVSCMNSTLMETDSRMLGCHPPTIDLVLLIDFRNFPSIPYLLTGKEDLYQSLA